MCSDFVGRLMPGGKQVDSNAACSFDRDCASGAKENSDAKDGASRGVALAGIDAGSLGDAVVTFNTSVGNGHLRSVRVGPLDAYCGGQSRRILGPLLHAARMLVAGNFRRL